ncbi:MBL fold metallo-hydrolase, partial [Acinetobacter baumannii]|nr:MBL fold metallo-hydrolase [Acinetobacter baumannii]
FLKTIHPVTCYAMRVVEKETGKIFVFTADSGYFEELISFSRNADLLITDTYFLEGFENHHAHLTSKETAYLATEANVKKLVLSHLNQTIDLSTLLSQTKDYLEGNIPVELAKTQLKITI